MRFLDEIMVAYDPHHHYHSHSIKNSVVFDTLMNQEMLYEPGAVETLLASIHNVHIVSQIQKAFYNYMISGNYKAMYFLLQKQVIVLYDLHCMIKHLEKRKHHPYTDRCLKLLYALVH